MLFYWIYQHNLLDELLQEAKKFIEEGVVPQVIIKGYQKAACLVKSYVLYL
jgi:chaperonin GroEL (HSP60 family)